MNTLQIIDLSVKVDDKLILNNLNLSINEGEIHVVMGPNGTGKSTLSKVIMGDPHYQVVKGTMQYKGKCLNELSVCDRSRLGIFLAMQMPTEIDGVSLADFLRTALHEKEKDEFRLMDFIKKETEMAKKLQMDKNMVHRALNVGFSGGEKKKNEILQMHLLEPSFVILDEIDSGLDVDSLKIVGKNIMDYYHKRKPAILIVTHYQRILDYVKPHFVHILKDGKIITTGDATLVQKIEKIGFDFLEEVGTGISYEK